MKTIEERFWEKVDKRGPDDCWEWTGVRNGKRYGRFSVQYGNKRKFEISSRVCYRLSVGEIPDGLKVLHTCDNPGCCNPKHLFLGTLKDNAQDRTQKGRGGNHKGNHNGRHKLTPESVQEIKRDYIRGSKEFGAVALAKKYGVSDSAIAFVVTGQTW